MAIRNKEGVIVSQKQAVKKKVLTKKEKDRSVVGKTGWWIKELALYEGVIKKETSTTFSVLSINRNVKNKEPPKERIVEKILFTLQEIEGQW